MMMFETSKHVPKTEKRYCVFENVSLVLKRPSLFINLFPTVRLCFSLPYTDISKCTKSILKSLVILVI